MRMISIFALLGLVLLGACQKRVEEPAARGQTIVVDNRQISGLDSIDRYVDTVELIQLESHPRGLIPDFVQGLLTGGDRLFFIDKPNHVITIFNFITGKFIQRLQPTGEGPGEYHSLSSVTFNPFAAELEVYAGFQNKLLIYSKDGVFLREEPVQFPYRSKIYMSPDWCAYFCLVENADYFAQDQSYKIVVQNQNTKELKFLQPLDKREAQQINLNSYYQFFNQSNGNTTFFEPIHSCDIKQVSVNEVKTRYRLKFIKNPMPEKFWEKNPQAIDEVTVARDNNFPFLDSYFFENARFAVFRYSFHGEVFLFGYDKQEKRAIFNTSRIGLAKWRFPIGAPFYVFQEGLLQICPAARFSKYLKNDPEKKYLPPAFFSIVKKLKPDDNPILMKVVFKNK